MGLQVTTTTSAPGRIAAKAKKAAAKQLATFPKVKPYDCPALALLVEHEELVRLFNIEDSKIIAGKGNKALRDRIGRRIGDIAEEASHCSPRSYDGAAFQILLASCEPGGLMDWPDESEARFNRLIYRAMDRLGSGLDAFPRTRKYYLPKRLDPAMRGGR